MATDTRSAREAWEQALAAAAARDVPFTTVSGREIDPLYRPAVPGAAWEGRVGDAGE